MTQFKFVNKKCLQRRISEVFRDNVVQNFVEICRFEICRRKKNLRWPTLEICSFANINKNPQKYESESDLSGSLNLKNIAV
jgi:hypothetical protein